MSRVIALTPNRYQTDRAKRLWFQIRLWFAHRNCAMDFAPINEPWILSYLKAAPFTGAIVWNGYGLPEVEEHVAYCEAATGKRVVRMEQGWFPQKDHVYISHGLGVTSTLSNEIQHKRWPVDMVKHEQWLAEDPDYPRPELPEDYILVCGQVPGDTNLVSVTCDIRDIPKMVRDVTDYPVVYRPHPKAKDPCDVPGVINVSPDTELAPQLAHARAVVAGTSTCLLEAARLSVPAVSLGMGVWTEAMIRYATPLTLRHVLANITEGWDSYERQYGVAVLHQQAEIPYRRVRLSDRAQWLLKGLM